MRHQTTSDTICERFSRHLDREFAALDTPIDYSGTAQRELREKLTLHREARARLMDRVAALHARRLPGGVICALMTRMVDRFVLYAGAAYGLDTGGMTGVALAALGGYGRRELNPYSDVDLLFLMDPEHTGHDGTVRDMLHYLWDINLDLGHSTRTPDECIAAASDDADLATSLLEARFLAGDRRLWDGFRDDYTAWLAGEAGRNLMTRKMDERDRRLDAFQRTVQIQEPNVKECPGGLRDIHTIRWLCALRAMARDGEDGTADRLLNPPEKVSLDDDLGFLLRTRNALHFVAGRKSDVIDHLSLPDVAANLRYGGSGVAPIEKFMRDYYMRAARVRRLADRVTARVMNSTAGPAAPVYRTIEPGIAASDRKVRLELENGETLRDHPGLMVRVLMAAGGRGLVPTGRTSSLIEACAAGVRTGAGPSPGLVAAFHEVVNMRTGVARTFRLMHEHGVMTVLIPEYAGISWHYQYDFYHTFTTDEHSIRVVENLDAMADGSCRREPDLCEMMQEVPARGALHLAGLLHDIGKARGGSHSVKGERMAAAALRRLGFDDRTVELVRFLIREHLLMSHTSQRRDTEDEDTIRDFTERVGSAGRLRMLTLLTFADLMALSEGALTDWKRALLRGLYSKALMRIEKGYEDAASRTIDVGHVVDRLRGRVPARAVKDHLDKLPEQYLRLNTPSEIAAHIRGIDRMLDCGAWASFRHAGALTRLTVIAPDYPRALSDICGTATSSDINIVGAQIFTRTDGIIIDTFLVVSGDGDEYIPAAAQREFKHNLPRVFYRDMDVAALIRGHIRRWRRRRRNVVHYPPRVRVHNDVSRHYTVIDVFATDYTGLLYDITSMLGAYGIDIHTARIGTDEDQVADAFYIQKDGARIEDDDFLEKLSAEMVARLSAASGQT